MAMTATENDLARAIARAHLDAVDDRGLMPLAAARRTVEQAREFTRGRGRRKGGAILFDRDVLWAALLSLEDAREFVRHARRLTWTADPRDESRTAPCARYGSGVLPWLGDHVDAEGNLVNSPACLGACLLALGTGRAFELAWRIRRVDGSEAEAVRLFTGWMRAHGRVGFPRLAARADAGDRRARKMLRHLANRRPEAVRDLLSARRGPARTEALLARIRVVDHLTESAVLSILDLAAERELDTDAVPWPLFRSAAGAGSMYHGLRLVAARARRGNGWGIVFERLTGTSPENARVEVYRYGSHVRPGLSLEHSRPLPFRVVEESEDGESLEGVVVRGPAGEVRLTAALAARPGVKARGLGLRSRAEADYVLRLRAYLARRPGAFWIDPRPAAAPLELGDAFDVIAASDAFTHVLGTDAGDVPRRDKFWLVRPSDTRVFRSLARAIAERDPSLFRPGKTNLECR